MEEDLHSYLALFRHGHVQLSGSWPDYCHS